MKKVRINVGKVGLVFKNGDYQKVITNGTYWLGFNQNVMLYDTTREFTPPIAIEILLQDEKLAEMLTVVDVKDNEFVLVYENDNLKKVLQSGRYVYWKGLLNRTFKTIDIGKIEITEGIDKNLFKNY